MVNCDMISQQLTKMFYNSLSYEFSWIVLYLPKAVFTNKNKKNPPHATSGATLCNYLFYEHIHI